MFGKRGEGAQEKKAEVGKVVIVVVFGFFHVLCFSFLTICRHSADVVEFLFL